MTQIPDEETRKKEFVERVSEDVLRDLTVGEKQYLRSHPDPYEHHFGLGMYIRNEYIHGKDIGFLAFMPDSLSAEIVEKIIDKLDSQ